MDNKYRFVVVGGGTAGWLSALYIRYKSPSSEIVVVQSDSIGIIGAGEGTTPPFLQLMESLKIPLSRLLIETNATVKNGIKFVNWQGSGDYYYHGFASSDEVGLHSFDNQQYLADTSMLFAYAEHSGKPFSDYNYVEKVSEENKVPLYVHPDYSNQLIPDPLHKYLYNSNYAVHFDAESLATFLSNVGTTERDIVCVEGTVVSETTNSQGDLESVTLDSGVVVDGDFFIDCTGFSNMFIGNLWGSEWVDHSKYLTVNSAMPFFLPQQVGSIPAYTESTAMKYGWAWKIPLQHRFGCGYVFDSNYLDDEGAKKEIVEFLGEEPVWPRKSSIKFQPGYYKTPWVKNCLAIGLSSGFIEPLEATSIWTAIIQLKEAFKDIGLIKNRNQTVIDEFNRYSCEVNESVFNFVYLHYMAGRTDTEFWKHYQSKSNTPKGLKNLFTTWQYRTPRYSDFSNDIFLLESWLSVAKGVSKINTATYKQFFESNSVPSHIEDDYNFLMQVQGEYVTLCESHTGFIQDLKKAAPVRQS